MIIAAVKCNYILPGVCPGSKLNLHIPTYTTDQVVNWVIVGVNCIISHQQGLLWRQTNCKLAICDDSAQFTLPEQSDWCNCIISHQQGLLWHQTNCKLAICDDSAQLTLPEQSDWCDNMPIHSYNYAPVLPVNVSRPYFRQGRRAPQKNLVSGDETTVLQALYMTHQATPIALTVVSRKYSPFLQSQPQYKMQGGLIHGM